MAIQDCYCINPRCSYPAHPNNNNSNARYCQSCGSQLLLNGKYRVSRLLSDHSGFGYVYEVFEGFNAKILKVLQERWNGEAKAIELFRREYEVLGALSSQGITSVPKGESYFEHQTKEGIPLYCLVMEKVEGIDLEQWVNQHDKINQKQALKWLKEIVLILDKIHQQNWFHRDIKPPNIMIRNTGELVLIDFGTAREETQTYYQKIQGQQLTGITSAGYTPNEQQHGQAVIQSDFFALGRTFVHLLTGKHPSEMYDAVNDQLNWREETENIDFLLLDFIDKLMARLPKDRPASAKVILQKLDEIERQLKQVSTKPTIIPKISVISTIPPSIHNKKLKKGLIAIGGVFLLGLGIMQSYGYLKYKRFPVTPQFLISGLVDNPSLYKTLNGHSNSVNSSVNSVVYSPDGRYLASGSSDNTVKTWDVEKEKELYTLADNSSLVKLVVTVIKLNLNNVYSVAYSPDGHYLAGGSGNLLQQELTQGLGDRLRIWDVKTRTKLNSLTGSCDLVYSVNYSPDGRYLAGGCIDHTVKIWDVETGQQLYNLTGHSDAITSVSYSPNGKYLASGSSDGKIRIWDAKTGKKISNFIDDSPKIYPTPNISGMDVYESIRIAYSRDGNYLASTSRNNTIKIWDVKTGQVLHTLTGHSGIVKSIAYSPDGRYLASGSDDGTIQIWRVGR